MNIGLSDSTKAGIRATWAARAKVPISFFERKSLNYVEKKDSTWVVVVELEGSRVAIAPPFAIPCLPSLDSKELLDLDSLVLALSDFSPRPLGSGLLLYAENGSGIPITTQTAYIPSNEQVDRFLAKCLATEVEESGLSKIDVRFGEVDPNGDLVALAGYEIWNESVAQFGVLVDPQFRSRGLGQKVASVSMEDALSKSLIPQWRVEVNNDPSIRVAARLGFIQLGSQLALEVADPVPHL